MTLMDFIVLLLVGATGVGAGVMLSGRRDASPEPTPAHRAPDAAPRARAIPGARAAAAVEPAPAATVPAWCADVLVVDDSAVARTKLRRLLEANGYSVHLARDGLEALERLDSGRYGLMISDLEMPNMDGIELIHTCQTRPATARMPILAVSGHADLRARFNACREVCGVHRKPWVDEVLASHVAALVGARSSLAATTASATAQPSVTA